MPKASQREEVELPCRADSVSDFSTFKSLIETLTHTLAECVKPKSVISSNKRLIKRAADEIMRATEILETKLEFADCLENPILINAALPRDSPPDCAVTIDAVRQTIREEIAKIKLPNVTTTAPTHTFADIVRSQRQTKNKEPTMPKTKPAIIVSSKTSVLNPAETLKTWRNSVSFRDTTFTPAAVKFVSNNKLRVEFDSVEQREITLKKINSPDSKVNAEISKALSPMVIIKGIPSEISADELVEAIKNQNEPIQKAITKPEDFVFKFKRANKNKDRYNAVFLTAPPVWRAVTLMVKINLDHQRVHADNYVPLLQCYKCLQYGHTKARCGQETEICSHCAEPGHGFQACPNKNKAETICCYNCMQHSKVTNSKPNTKHSATSSLCPRQHLMTQKIIARTDYGQ